LEKEWLHHTSTFCSDLICGVDPHSESWFRINRISEQLLVFHTMFGKRNALALRRRFMVVV